MAGERPTAETVRRAGRVRRTGRLPVGVALLCGAGFLVACGPSSAEDAERTPTSEEGLPFVPAETPPAEFARDGDDSSPERFGVGQPAAPAHVAALDIDVTPDGHGLPEGSGTVSEGADVYSARCASCHGPEGMTRAPGGGGLLVAEGDRHAFVDGSDPGAFGKRTVGSYWPYATTLFDYVRRTMPFDRPGSLTDDEVYAVVAWILWKNELIAEDAVMDARTLPEVEMPARDRFVPDDRLESTRVR